MYNLTDCEDADLCVQTTRHIEWAVQGTECELPQNHTPNLCLVHGIRVHEGAPRPSDRNSY